MQTQQDLEAVVKRVDVRRSSRRTRTISARLENGTLILFIPASLSFAEETRWAETMRGRFEARHRKQRINSAGDLERRARELNARYFGGTLSWRSIEYVTNQNSRYGSCTVHDSTIRLSDKLVGMPVWVRDYVIVHELAHLLEPNHSPAFWALVDSYPLSERAKGYLIAKGMEE